MLRRFTLLLTLFVCSCSLPATFRSNLKKFVDEASRLNSLTEQGVTFDRYADQLATASATYDLLESSWPKITRLRRSAS
jgi:hypothetical protein